MTVSDQDREAAQNALLAITDDECNMRHWPKETLAEHFAQHLESLRLKVRSAIAAQARSCMYGCGLCKELDALDDELEGSK